MDKQEVLWGLPWSRGNTRGTASRKSVVRIPPILGSFFRSNPIAKSVRKLKRRSVVDRRRKRKKMTRLKPKWAKNGIKIVLKLLNNIMCDYNKQKRSLKRGPTFFLMRFCHFKWELGRGRLYLSSESSLPGVWNGRFTGTPGAEEPFSTVARCDGEGVAGSECYN